LQEAHYIAEQNGYQRLLEEIIQLEQSLPAGSI
jgi:hypothetical protein